MASLGRIIVVILGTLFCAFVVFLIWALGLWTEPYAALHNTLAQERSVEKMQCGSLAIEHVYEETYYTQPGVFGILQLVNDPTSFDKLKIRSGNAEATMTIGHHGLFFRSTNPEVRIEEIFTKRVPEGLIFTPYERAHYIEIGELSPWPQHLPFPDDRDTLEEKVDASNYVVFIGLPSSFVSETQFSELKSCSGFRAFVERTFKYESRSLIYLYLYEA